jgi:hypothetical protein
MTTLKAKYKILVSEAEKLKPIREKRNYTTVDSFDALCELKGIKPSKGIPRKRVLRNSASIYSYPNLNEVAIRAEFTKPLDEYASSKQLTSEYVKQFLSDNHLVDVKAVNTKGREQGYY